MTAFRPHITGEKATHRGDESAKNHGGLISHSRNARAARSRPRDEVVSPVKQSAKTLRRYSLIC